MYMFIRTAQKKKKKSFDHTHHFWNCFQHQLASKKHKKKRAETWFVGFVFVILVGCTYFSFNMLRFFFWWLSIYNLDLIFKVVAYLHGPIHFILFKNFVFFSSYEIFCEWLWRILFFFLIFYLLLLLLLGYKERRLKAFYYMISFVSFLSMKNKKKKTKQNKNKKMCVPVLQVSFFFPFFMKFYFLILFLFDCQTIFIQKDYYYYYYCWYILLLLRFYFLFFSFFFF